MRSGKIKPHRDAVANVVGSPGGSQQRTTGVLASVLSSILVLLLGVSLIPASAASAALPGAVQAAVPTASQLLDFTGTTATVRVGGQLADTVWVTPKAGRTVYVQYRRAGTTPFTTAYKAKASASGAFTAFLTPPAAGTWQFRLFAVATTQAKAVVSPIRTVKASGTAVSSQVIGFATTRTTIPVGTAMLDAVSVSPRASRLVELQSRRAGSSTWTWSKPGRTTTAGNFTVVYRPMSAGVFQYRLWVRASTTARGAISATRTVTAATKSVTGLFVKADSSTSESIALHWVNPTYAGFTGVMIRRAVGSTAPATPASGTLVRDLIDDVPYMVDINEITGGKTYSYALFAHDDAPNYAAAAKVTFTTAVKVKPAAVLSISDEFANETTTGTVGESLFFYAGDSAKGPSAASVVLNYGDNTSPKEFGLAGDPTDWSEYHTFTRAGTYQVTLKITDTAGVVITNTMPITIT